MWPPLAPDVYLRRPASRLPYPLEEPGCRLTAWARQGLWHGARALGLGPGDHVLVPSYHHGSEVEALLRAGVGCRFYECTESLQPDPRELESLLGPGVRALHLTHFGGLPQDAAHWRRWCDERGLLLIEDAAQAWLASAGGRPVGSFGDLSVFCLYKTVGLPEGAAVVLPRRPHADGLPAIQLDRRPGLADLARQHAVWVAGRSSGAYAAARLRRRTGAHDPVAEIALRDPQAGPWSTTCFVLRRLVDPQIAARRRSHYRALMEALGDLVAPGFGDPPDGASPFMFPIQIDGKAAALEVLRRHGVIALDFWANPHPSLPVDAFPGAARRRAGTIALPVHQELRRRDLDRIVAAVRRATSRPG